MKYRDENTKSHVWWCCQQKRGIKIEEPNDNLCKAYILKAKSALNMLDSALEKEEIDWIATTAYYSRYFVIYALLQKAGVKCEIHDCTISLMPFLLVEEGIIEEKFYRELQAAKKSRVDLQYYTQKPRKLLTSVMEMNGQEFLSSGFLVQSNRVACTEKLRFSCITKIIREAAIKPHPLGLG